MPTIKWYHKVIIFSIAMVIFSVWVAIISIPSLAVNVADDTLTNAAIGSAQMVGVTIIDGAVTSTRIDGVDLVVTTDGNLSIRMSDGTLLPLMGCGYTGRQCTPADNIEPTGFGWNVGYRGYIWEAECDCYAIQNLGDGYFATKTPCQGFEDSERIVK